MPSRRQLLTGAGITLVGGAAGASVVSRAQPEPGPVASSHLDWPLPRYDPAGTGYNPDASGPANDVRVAWAHDAPAWFRGASAPIRLGDTLYAIGHGLLALAVDGGERRFGNPGPYTSSAAAATASSYRTLTLAVTATGGIYGLNAGGGLEVPGLDRAIGSRRWTGPGSGRYRSTIEHRPTVDPVAVDGTVYAPVPGTNDVAAVDADSGSTRWCVTVNDDETVGTSFGQPTVRDGALFVANWPGQVLAYDCEDGTELWQREAALHDDVDHMRLCSPATDARVVVTTRHGVALLEADTGDVLWWRDLEGNAVDGAAAVAEGTIFLSDGRERFHALDLETGESLWSVPFDGETTPVVADGMVYAVERDAALVGLDAETGDERFRYESPEVPLSTPIVGDDRLYAVARSRVIALEETP
ncbi:PQQ-binding-like beta-propeller repeat protein [Halopiger xanaduensis]|uniref:Pyrrolo-quinoline quinone repeat-containing protein n=1 Tax=Halopiger xanaduensis (strain DSM 18323 / JCM 14033 / SH-6) TaxID=797210 RepID=F8DDQ8_HALXS|nr:PQQ-binding-like beta-propeller repeat protein [Halopiger xanaduensis]AEH39160.1 Pyrrolo-quinoline quinone repeat-containing protein [Halopiger xanaduensis SH-6]